MGSKMTGRWVATAPTAGFPTAGGAVGVQWGRVRSLSAPFGRVESPQRCALIRSNGGVAAWVAATQGRRDVGSKPRHAQAVEPFITSEVALACGVTSSRSRCPRHVVVTGLVRVSAPETPQAQTGASYLRSPSAGICFDGSNPRRSASVTWASRTRLTQRSNGMSPRTASMRAASWSLTRGRFSAMNQMVTEGTPLHQMVPTGTMDGWMVNP